MRRVSVGRLRSGAARLRQDVHALALACRDPRTPWYAKLTAALVVAYALSPIDLIPDFIPVFGQVDDLVLIPLGVMLVVWMVPRDVMTDCRARAADAPMSVGRWVAAALIVAVWLGCALLAYRWWQRR